MERFPSGKYRAVVRHGGAKRASEAVPTKAEARMSEAKLKLEMGSQPSIREQHSVGEVVSGYLADGAVRLSPATLDFYRKGHAAMPDAFKQRPVTTVTPLVLDSLHAELRHGGASEHKCLFETGGALRCVRSVGMSFWAGAVADAVARYVRGPRVSSARAR